MLLTLILWLFTFLFSCIYGLMLIRLFQFMFRLKPEEIPTPAELFFTGIAFLTVFTLYTSLFIKIGLIADIILISGAVIYTIIDSRFIRNIFLKYENDPPGLSPFLIKAALAIFLILLFETSAYRPKNYDTALYHAQAIHWAESLPGDSRIG